MMKNIKFWFLLFLDAQAPTPVSITLFWISILSASLRAHKESRQHCGGRHGGWLSDRLGGGHGGQHGGGQGGQHGGQQKKITDMELDMMADSEVDKVADIEVDMVADMEVDMVDEININIEIQFGESVGQGVA